MHYLLGKIADEACHNAHACRLYRLVDQASKFRKGIPSQRSIGMLLECPASTHPVNDHRRLIFVIPQASSARLNAGQNLPKVGIMAKKSLRAGRSSLASIKTTAIVHFGQVLAYANCMN